MYKKNILNFYGSGACEEYIQIEEGGSDRVDSRIAPVEWTPGIGFFIVLLGSLVTGGGAFYILGNIDEEWKAVIKKQELIERQEEIQKERLTRIKNFWKNSRRLKNG